MPGKVVEEFQKKRTASLMQKHLMIGKSDALKILENFDLLETKLFSENIPKLEGYINFLVGGGTTNIFITTDPMSRMDIKNIREPLDGADFPGIAIRNPPEFTPAFRDLLATKLPPLLLNRLSMLLSVKELLHYNFNKSETDIQNIISALKPSALPQLYDYLTNGVGRMLKLFNKPWAITYRESNELADKVFNFLHKTYNQIPIEVGNQLFSREIIPHYFNADRALENILYVEAKSREDILSHWPPVNVRYIHAIVVIRKDDVLNQIQSHLGENRIELVNRVFSPHWNYVPAGGDPPDEFYDARSFYLIPKMISAKFMSIINAIPQVVAFDDRGRRLNHKIIDQNQQHISEAYELLASGNTNLTHLQFESLPAYVPPPPPAEPWINPRYQMPFLVIGTVVGVGAALIAATYTYDSLRRQFGFWTRVIGLDAEAENKLVAKYLLSLPKAKKLNFLSSAEIEKFKEYNNKLTAKDISGKDTKDITEKDIKEHNERDLKRYEDFMKKTQCLFTLDDPHEIEDPLTIEYIGMKTLIDPQSEIVNDPEWTTVRKWSFTYSYDLFLQHVAKVSKNVLIPQTLDPIIITPTDTEQMNFKRGFPDFVEEFIDKVRLANKGLSKSLIDKSSLFKRKEIAIDIEQEQNPKPGRDKRK